MKHLQDYREQAQTELFNATGAFFAFNDSQFKEGLAKAKNNADANHYVDGDKWTSCGHGMLVMTKHIDMLLNGLEAINKSAIAQDVIENGKQAIIIRELYNYESFYTGNILDAVAELKQYGYSAKDVREAYNLERTIN